MTDLRKYYLVFLFKLFPLGKELGFTPREQLRIDSPNHDQLFRALHRAVEKVIKDFGGLSYKNINAEAKDIKRGPNNAVAKVTKRGPNNSGARYLESK